MSCFKREVRKGVHRKNCLTLRQESSLRNKGPKDSSASFTFQSSSKLQKTFRVKEIKIDYQIRDLMKHTLRVPNLFSSFYEMVSPILSQLLLQFLKYHLHFRPQLCLPDSGEGYRSEPLWLWKMQNFSPSTTR